METVSARRRSRPWTPVELDAYRFGRRGRLFRDLRDPLHGPAEARDRAPTRVYTRASEAAVAVAGGLFPTSNRFSILPAGGVRAAPCPNSSSPSGTTSATSFVARFPTSPFTSGSTRSSSPASSTERCYVRAPDHIRTWVRDRYLPVVRRRRRAGLPGRRRRGDRRRGLAPADRRRRPGSGAGHCGEPRLNPKYTFEQFVIGRGNRFAHAGALAVRRAPGPGLQPALHPRPARARQDPPAARRRELRDALRLRPDRALRDRRGVHDRVRPRRPDARTWTRSRSASAAWTSSCSTTSSSSRTRPARRRSSFTPSTPCATPAGSW